MVHVCLNMNLFYLFIFSRFLIDLPLSLSLSQPLSSFSRSFKIYTLYTVSYHNLSISGIPFSTLFVFDDIPHRLKLHSFFWYCDEWWCEMMNERIERKIKIKINNLWHDPTLILNVCARFLFLSLLFWGVHTHNIRNWMEICVRYRNLYTYRAHTHKRDTIWFDSFHNTQIKQKREKRSSGSQAILDFKSMRREFGKWRWALHTHSIWHIRTHTRTRTRTPIHTAIYCNSNFDSNKNINARSSNNKIEIHSDIDSYTHSLTRTHTRIIHKNCQLTCNIFMPFHSVSLLLSHSIHSTFIAMRSMSSYYHLKWKMVF